MKKILSFLGVLLVLPICVNALSIEEQVKNKEITFDSIPPTEIEEFYFISEQLYNDYSTDDSWWGIDYETCNDDFTECDISHTYVDGKDSNGYDMYKNESFENIKISYNYDEDIKTVVANLIKDLPDKIELTLTDIEYIDYLIKNYYSDNEDYLNMATFSSELKKYIGYKNFEVEPRMGDMGPYYESMGGNATFKYNGIIYGFAEYVNTTGKQIIYLKEGTKDIEKAIKDKLSVYFDVKKVEKNGTKEEVIEEFRQGEMDYFTNYIAPYLNDQNSWFYQMYKDTTAEEYAQEEVDYYFNDDDAPMKIVADCEDDVYKIAIGDDFEEDFFVMFDNEKAEEASFISNDLTSDVTIKTDAIIPLDTLIQVYKLTDGEEYDKIVKILNKDNIEMFDLNLFSKSIGEYITKLDNGSFEVRIPISEAFKGKDLVVYYVDENDEIKEYTVVIDGDYAVFETDHFSIYTLAEKEVAKEETKTDGIVNPNTSDNIMLYVSMFIISLASVGTLVLRKNN